MIQFLKSILLPRSSIQGQKEKKAKAEIMMLTARITLLEEENKKSADAIQELSKCMQAISMMTADLAGDVTLLGSHLSAILKQTQTALDEDDIFKRYMSSDDDDGGGYLN